MLEPRQADIPVLFLVLVVLPLVAYILLGKWSEATKKRERISLLAQVAAEEALRAETMAVANTIPLIASSKIGHHACARCFAPATTRCSRCKSVRYWYVLFLVYDCSYLFSLLLYSYFSIIGI
jgi:ubiquitin carboxyl-terminal hydrolase 36/42